MKPDEGTDTVKTGRIAIATIVFLGAAFLVGALIGNVPWRSGHAVLASGTPAGNAGRAEKADRSPLPGEPPGGGKIHERHETAAGSSRADGEGDHDGAMRVRHGDEAQPADSWSPGRGAPRADEPRQGPGATLGASRGVAPPPPSQLAPGASPTPTERSSHGASPGPSDVRAGVQPTPYSGSSSSSSLASSSTSSVSQTTSSGSREESSVPRDEAPAADRDPDSDRTAPVLDSLGFDPPEIPDGGVTSLVVHVSDDLSGVRAVSGSLRSPSGAAFLPFAADGEAGASVFTAKIRIPSKAETGNWYVANLYILDRANNPLIAGFTAPTVPPGGTLRVSSPESDSAAPEVHGVSVESAALHDGEKNLIRVEVQDDRSGVASVTGVFQSPSRSALIPFMCRANAESGLWEGDVQVPVNADCGEWTLQNLRIADNAGNIAYLSSTSPLLAHVAFEVLGQGDCDSSPPTLETFNLSPTTVSNETGAEILVTATARDDRSGVVYVSGQVDGPVSTNGQIPKIYFSCTRDPRDPNAPWTGKIIVPQYAARGTWKVSSVRVQDKALNARDYTRADPVIARATFDVQ